MNRLREQRLPTHSVEIGYLNDLLTVVKLILHHTPDQPVTAEQLAEWPLVHRAQFRGCSAFNRLNAVALLSHTPIDNLYNVHAADIERIDVFIKALQQGLSEGQLTKYVTLADVQTIGMTRDRLSACTEKIRWD